jgi:hypothetical protein
LPTAPHLYSTLSPPCRRKQTMTRRMDDQTNGRMDDEMISYIKRWKIIIKKVNKKRVVITKKKK